MSDDAIPPEPEPTVPAPSDERRWTLEWHDDDYVAYDGATIIAGPSLSEPVEVAPATELDRARAEGEAARTAEIERLREALTQLMYEARAYIEPYGSSANPAMHTAREALAARFNPEAE